MVGLYVMLIKVRMRTIDDVPSKFKDAVKANLIVMGFDENGNSIVTP